VGTITTDAPATPHGLRAAVLRGGGHLVLRQLVGVGMAVGGVTLLARWIGPVSYGTYAAAAALFLYAAGVAQAGIGTYLIRLPRSLAEAELDAAFTLLVALSVVGTGLTIGLAVMGSIWVAVLLMLPVQSASLVPLAKLERALDYRSVARIELAGQLSLYVVALPAAFLGAAVWAPVAGWWAQQIVAAALAFLMARYRPRLAVDGAAWRGALAYGIGFAGAGWLWQLRALVPPLVLGRWAGAEAVGVVALALRLVDALAFVKTAAWRLAIASMAKLAHDPAALRRAIGHGTAVQVVALSAAFLGFELVAPFLVGTLFGDGWSGIIIIFPFVATAWLANAAFSMNAAALHVLGRNRDAGTFNAVHVALLASAAFVLVPHFGLIGYGFAELVAIAAYAVLWQRLAAVLGAPEGQGIALFWAAGLGIALFWPLLGPWALFAVLPALCLPSNWRSGREYVIEALSYVRGGRS
jgi:PST family polysaccharide transporter